jgi:hypothetical protein
VNTISKALVTVLAALVVAVAPNHVRQIERVAFATITNATTDSTDLTVVSDHDEAVKARPSPALAPADVVEIVVDALGVNDRPYANAGAEVAYRFSSPDNRLTTGPLNKFVELVHNPVYSPVLNHLHARYGTIEVSENKASVPVIIVSEEAERHGYLFTLKRQIGGELDGCWMMDSVIPFDVGTEEEPALVLKT